MMRRPFIVAIVILIACYLYMGITYPRLPDRIAVHFNAKGAPDNWGDKSNFATFYPLFTLAFNALFLFIVPFLIRKSPESIVNMPDKEYWLLNP